MLRPAVLYLRIPILVDTCVLIKMVNIICFNSRTGKCAPKVSLKEISIWKLPELNHSQGANKYHYLIFINK